jgi:maleylacetate reductase
MTPFVYTALPVRVVFGHGTIAQVADEVQRLGCRRALVLSTPEQRAEAERLHAQMGASAVGIFAEATMHTPVDVSERAVAAARDLRADCTVALGGGSTTGLGKAVALRTDLPQVVVPTTYAGSEATPVLGETADGRKTTQRTLKVLPEVIVYDVDLTLSLPPALSATSGMNAIAHAIEALYAQDANPVTSVLAEQGIVALARALPRIVEEPGHRAARAEALYGAWTCGTCLGAVGMALHHKLCHVLGGSFNLPHAQTHTVVLPHAVAYNAPAAPGAMARAAAALATTNVAQALYDLAHRLGAPLSLRELGMKETDLDSAAELACASPYWNPRPFTRDDIRGLLQAAFDGARPN